jgi:hypothetical protein
MTALIRIFGAERDKERAEWRELHEEFHDL